MSRLSDIIKKLDYYLIRLERLEDLVFIMMNISRFSILSSAQRH